MIELTYEQKLRLARIIERSDKITAMIALHMAKPDASGLGCVRYILDEEEQLKTILEKNRLKPTGYIT